MKDFTSYKNVSVHSTDTNTETSLVLCVAYWVMLWSPCAYSVWSMVHGPKTKWEIAGFILSLFNSLLFLQMFCTWATAYFSTPDFHVSFKRQCKASVWIFVLLVVWWRTWAGFNALTVMVAGVNLMSCNLVISNNRMVVCVQCKVLPCKYQMSFILV